MRIRTCILLFALIALLLLSGCPDPYLEKDRDGRVSHIVYGPTAPAPGQGTVVQYSNIMGSSGILGRYGETSYSSTHVGPGGVHASGTTRRISIHPHIEASGSSKDGKKHWKLTTE